jgi:hypothetical protein
MASDKKNTNELVSDDDDPTAEPDLNVDAGAHFTAGDAADDEHVEA